MLAVGALALVAGCLRATVTRCENGAICPEGQACTEQASLCGPETRVEACAGKSQFDACDPNGTCHAGICDPCTDDLAGCYSATWRPMTSGTTKNLRAVWVREIDDAFAVGDDGTALHYDGFAWSHVTDLETLATTSPLIGIWGSSTGELFVLAGNRKMFHFARDVWEQQTLASIRPLAAIGGQGPNAVYAAGLLGEVWSFDGTMWSSVTTGSTSEVYAGVWATAQNGVYLVGTDAGAGIVRHYNGSTWQKDFTLPNNPLLGVWGDGIADIYAIGAPDTATPLAHYKTTWMPVTTTANGLALWGSSADDVFAAGPSGIYHYDGQAWDDRGGNDMPINAIHGSAKNNVIAVGPNGSIWRLARP